MSSPKPVKILSDAVWRSVRVAVLLGVTGALLGLLLELLSPRNDLVAFGIIPMTWFTIGLGGLCVLAAYSRWIEFKELEFELVDAGVRTRETLITWEEVREFYRGGTIYLAQGLIHSGADRKLKIVAKDDRVIELDLKFVGRISQAVKAAFDEVCEQIVRRISDRQRRELDARLIAGERVRFNDSLWVGEQGLSFRREGPPDVELASVQGLEVVEGRLKLRYLDAKGRPRAQAIGRFRETANVHLLAAYLRRDG